MIKFYFLFLCTYCYTLLAITENYSLQIISPTLCSFVSFHSDTCCTLKCLALKLPSVTHERAKYLLCLGGGCCSIFSTFTYLFIYFPIICSFIHFTSQLQPTLYAQPPSHSSFLYLPSPFPLRRERPPWVPTQPGSSSYCRTGYTRPLPLRLDRAAQLGEQAPRQATVPALLFQIWETCTKTKQYICYICVCGEGELRMGVEEDGG